MTDLSNLTEEKAQWFSIQSSDELQQLDHKFNDCIRQIQDMRAELSDCRMKIHHMETENLRLVNRILEAEISMERYKNLLLRKNISFPFAPITAKIFQGIQM